MRSVVLPETIRAAADLTAESNVVSFSSKTGPAHDTENTFHVVYMGPNSDPVLRLDPLGTLKTMKYIHSRKVLLDVASPSPIIFWHVRENPSAPKDTRFIYGIFLIPELSQ
jgi:hypothetical protein